MIKKGSEVGAGVKQTLLNSWFVIRTTEEYLFNLRDQQTQTTPFGRRIFMSCWFRTPAKYIYRKRTILICGGVDGKTAGLRGVARKKKTKPIRRKFNFQIKNRFRRRGAAWNTNKIHPSPLLHSLILYFLLQKCNSGTHRLAELDNIFSRLTSADCRPVAIFTQQLGDVS